MSEDGGESPQYNGERFSKGKTRPALFWGLEINSQHGLFCRRNRCEVSRINVK